MGIRDFFKPKDHRDPYDASESFEYFAARRLEEFRQNDHLGMAARAGEQARAAKESGNYDRSWSYYHDMKSHYLQHAQNSGFTRAQALSLDASVHQPLADILRLEGKHHAALVHVIYWVACSERVTKTQQKKLSAYFNRCKFKAISHADLQKLVDSCRNDPDFAQIRNAIGQWSETDA